MDYNFRDIFRLSFCFFFESIKLTTIANATLFGTMAPIFSLIINKLFFNEKLHYKVYLGLIICMFGSICLHINSITLGVNYILGNIYAIICSFLLAIAYIIGKKVRKKTSTYLYTRTLFLSASITLLLITLVFEKPLIGFKLNEYFIFFLLGFIPTIIGHGILSYSLKYFSTTIVTSIPVGEPVIASILAWFIFKEKISLTVIVCALLVLTGLILIIQNRNKHSNG